MRRIPYIKEALVVRDEAELRINKMATPGMGMPFRYLSLVDDYMYDDSTEDELPEDVVKKKRDYESAHDISYPSPGPNECPQIKVGYRRHNPLRSGVLVAHMPDKGSYVMGSAKVPFTFSEVFDADPMSEYLDKPEGTHYVVSYSVVDGRVSGIEHVIGCQSAKELVSAFDRHVDSLVGSGHEIVTRRDLFSPFEEEDEVRRVWPKYDVPNSSIVHPNYVIFYKFKNLSSNRHRYDVEDQTMYKFMVWADGSGPMGKQLYSVVAFRSDNPEGLQNIIRGGDIVDMFPDMDLQVSDISKTSSYKKAFDNLRKIYSAMKSKGYNVKRALIPSCTETRVSLAEWANKS